MLTVTLNQGEIIAILDALHSNAYDKLQQALEAKIPDDKAAAWLESWEAQQWEIKLNLNYEEVQK